MRPNLQIILLLVSTAGAQPYVVSTLAGGSPPPVPGAASGFSLGIPGRVVVDPAGNLYFGADYMILKVDTKGVLTIVAGNARPGCGGDGGPAANAQIKSPQGIGFDSKGNLYFADSLCNSVRRVDTSGNIKTVAGSGLLGAPGDGGPALSAALNAPVGITLDGSDNLYIADSGDHEVRRVLAADNSIGTFAGNGTRGSGSDNILATQSTLSAPVDVTFDPDGNLYIADWNNEIVRMVDTQSLISTFAGTGVYGAGTDSPVPTRSAFQNPSGLAWDPRSRSLLITDSDSVRAVSQTGIHTIAGGAAAPAPGLANGQPVMGTALTSDGIAVDSFSNIFVATHDSRVWRISGGGTATAVAGNGFLAYSGDGGPAATAQLHPDCVAVDRSQNVYFADQSANVVRKISAAGIISTVAGTGQAGNSGDGGPAVKALLTPSCVSVDRAGNLYIPDATHSVVRRVSAQDGSISTVAGSGSFGIVGDEGPAPQAQLESPVTTASDSFGNLYIGDAGSCAIRQVTSDGLIHTVAGHLTQAPQQISTACYSFITGDGVAATSAALNQPVSLAVDNQNNVWFVDQGIPNPGASSAGTPPQYIREVTPDGVIHMIAGQGGSLSDNIPASTAMLPVQTTSRLAVDSAGSIYFTYGNRVRKIDAKGTLTSVAGDGKMGYSPDGGAATQAEFWGISSVAADTNGNLYVSDSGAGTIRLLQPGNPVTVPSITSVANAASNQPGPLAPGEIVTIFGTGLGPATASPAVAAPNAAGVFPTSLAGASVLFNGTPAPMIYASATQSAAVVPYEVSGSNVQVSLQYQGVTGQPVTIPLTSAAPALFTVGTGTGQAAVVNQDGSVNGATHPAPQGSVIILYATGEGATSPAGIDGSVTGGSLPKPVLPVTVTIGGIAANVLYAGEAPSEIAGIMQLNVMVPTGLTPSAAVPVVLKVGNTASPSGVTIAVGN
jgi:uncharacterized protein (TIGR03437 family)